VTNAIVKITSHVLQCMQVVLYQPQSVILGEADPYYPTAYMTIQVIP